MTTLTDDDLPGYWRDGDVAALGGQRWTLLYARGRLVGAVCAAVGGVLAWTFEDLNMGAALVAVGVAVALYCEIASWAQQPTREWYEGRALAESAKSLAWRFAVCAEPFPETMPTDEAHRILRDRLRTMHGQSAASVVVRSKPAFVTPAMDSLRTAAFAERRDAYVRGRTEDQQDWYSQKAAVNRRAAGTWRMLLIAWEIVALTLAAASVLGGPPVTYAGLVGAVIAALTAWVAVRQHVPLSWSYATAAAELAYQSDILRATSRDDWSRCAGDAEDAISREHTLWLASRHQVPRPH